MLEGDKTIWGLFVTTLPTNAVIRINKEECIITISEEVGEEVVLISIRDNGKALTRDAVEDLCTQFHYQIIRNRFGTGQGAKAS